MKDVFNDDESIFIIKSNYLLEGNLILLKGFFFSIYWFAFCG